MGVLRKRNPNFGDEFMAVVTAKSRRGKVQACLLIYQRVGETFLSDKAGSPAANKVIKSQIVVGRSLPALCCDILTRRPR